MATRILVTGITGQDGLLLAKRFVEQGHQVAGFVRSIRQARAANTDIPEPYRLSNAVELIEVEPAEAPRRARSFIESFRPDELYNLAAVPSVAAANAQPELATIVNVDFVEMLLATIATASKDTRFFQASTGLVFGDCVDGADELATVCPSNHYAKTKAEADVLVRKYRKRGVFACSGYLFSHESRLRRRGYAARDIIGDVVSIARSLKSDIAASAMRRRDLDQRREFAHAEDAMDAAVRMLRQPSQPRDFVIATGRGVSLRDFLVCAFQCLGIAEWAQYAPEESGPRRTLVGSPLAIADQLGWQPKHDLASVVQEMVQHELESTWYDRKVG